eukprot:14148515-Alexandrium_andersonii.AAC.1
MTPIDAPATNAAGCMARHGGLKPLRDLPRSAPGPSANNDRRDGNRSEPRDEGHIILRILRDVHLSPPPER